MRSEQQELLALQRGCERNLPLATAAIQQLTAICVLLRQQIRTPQAAAGADVPTSSSSSCSIDAAATMQHLTSSIPEYHKRLLHLLPGDADEYIHLVATEVEDGVRQQHSISREAKEAATATPAASTAEAAAAGYLKGLLTAAHTTVMTLHHIVDIVLSYVDDVSSSSGSGGSSSSSCNAALAAHHCPALLTNALQLTLELQLLVTLLLQQQQEQQQQQKHEQAAAHAAAQLLETCNELLIVQLCASIAMHRIRIQGGNTAAVLQHHSCSEALQQSSLQLLQALAAPFSAGARNRCCFRDLVFAAPCSARFDCSTLQQLLCARWVDASQCSQFILVQ
jgi:hypothetical protein